MLKWIRKYKELFYMLGIIISSIVGTFLGDGILWKSQENEREKAKLELAKFESAKEIRIQIDNLYQNLFKLNEDYIKQKQHNTFFKNDSLLLIRKLEYILDNYDAYDLKLSKIENEGTRDMFLPYPLNEFRFVRRMKLYNLQFEPIPVHLFEKSPLTVNLFIGFIIVYSVILVFMTRYFVKKKILKS